MFGGSENQFSLTRAALGTRGAQSNFLSLEMSQAWQAWADSVGVVIDPDGPWLRG